MRKNPDKRLVFVAHPIAPDVDDDKVVEPVPFAARLAADFAPIAAKEAA
jgi:hypothetical protein